MDTVIVLVLVTLALWYAVHRFLSARSGCGCGCSGTDCRACSSAGTASSPCDRKTGRRDEPPAA